jgi:hypothetical protein
VFSYITPGKKEEIDHKKCLSSEPRHCTDSYWLSRNFGEGPTAIPNDPSYYAIIDWSFCSTMEAVSKDNHNYKCFVEKVQ